MQVPALPHPHVTALLAEITPFDPEEDDLDSCGSEAALDTRTEEWWVLREAGGGDAGGQEGCRMSSPTVLSPQGRSAGAWLAGAGLREDGAAAGDAEKAGGEHRPPRGDWGGCWAEVAAERAPCPPVHPGWDPGEENLRGNPTERKRDLGVPSWCSLTCPHARGTLHL